MKIKVNVGKDRNLCKIDYIRGIQFALIRELFESKFTNIKFKFSNVKILYTYTYLRIYIEIDNVSIIGNSRFGIVKLFLQNKKPDK